MTGHLYRRSIEIILNHQDPGGAYPASPSFPTYHYCWMRDGSYTAYAMDLVGHPESAERFHHWAARTINAHHAQIRRAMEKARRGDPLTERDYLHTRFTLSGEESADGDWPNLQLDGYGTWLWSLGQYFQRHAQPLPGFLCRASDAVAAYLTALWDLPCYDCWEEFPDRVHSYTLAAVLAGLRAHARLRGADNSLAIRGIEAVLMEQSVAGDCFVKYLGSDQVDASLIALAVPYDIVPATEPRMSATVARIEKELRSGGGVHRYAGDTYYGGGEWVLLTAWLGWYYQEAGMRDKALEALHWVEAQADALGQLPEQVPASLIDPTHFQPWVRRWGEIARPLLWSHTKYLILCRALDHNL